MAAPVGRVARPRRRSSRRSRPRSWRSAAPRTRPRAARSTRRPTSGCIERRVRRRWRSAGGGPRRRPRPATRTNASIAAASPGDHAGLGPVDGRQRQPERQPARAAAAASGTVTIAAAGRRVAQRPARGHQRDRVGQRAPPRRSPPPRTRRGCGRTPPPGAGPRRRSSRASAYSTAKIAAMLRDGAAAARRPPRASPAGGNISAADVLAELAREQRARTRRAPRGRRQAGRTARGPCRRAGCRRRGTRTPPAARGRAPAPLTTRACAAPLQGRLRAASASRQTTTQRAGDSAGPLLQRERDVGQRERRPRRRRYPASRSAGALRRGARTRRQDQQLRTARDGPLGARRGRLLEDHVGVRAPDPERAHPRAPRPAPPSATPAARALTKNGLLCSSQLGVRRAGSAASAGSSRARAPAPP